MEPELPTLGASSIGPVQLSGTSPALVQILLPLTRQGTPERMEILDGLLAGTAVVLEGLQNLQDGARVDATEPPAALPPASVAQR